MRTATRDLQADDRGVVGAVGAVLLLAVIVTVVADLARTDVPRWGAEAETTWRDSAEASLKSLATDASRGIGSAAHVSVTMEPPREGQRVDIPLLGLLAPQTATASLTFEPNCASFDASHTRFGGPPVVDLVDASPGCMALSASNVYTASATTRLEHGALIRLEGGRDVIVAGPALHLRAVNATTYDVALALPSLRGPASTISVADGGARVDLAPRGHALEASPWGNAASVTWTIETRNPVAWKAYFERALQDAGFVASRVPGVGQSPADYTVACVPFTCALTGGKGTVVVTIEGPRIDSDDIRLALSHGAFDVSMR